MTKVLETRHIKASRKGWRCNGCGRPFDPGTPKTRQRNIGEDGPYNWQACPTCWAITQEILALPGWDSWEGVSDDNIFEHMQRAFGSWAKADEHYRASTSEEK